jgi:anaerobic dimethyl sulfoxide reductase subunit C (anchor subunit)
VLMVILLATSYMMPARPVWSTPVLYVFYLAQALVAGAAVLWLVGSVVKADDAEGISARLTALGGACVVVSLVIYAAYIASIQLPEVGYYFDPTHPTKAVAETSDFASRLLSGSLALQFWGALIIGGVIPAITGVLKWKKSSGGAPFAAIAIICALAGGIAFRVVLYALGVSVFIFY